MSGIIQEPEKKDRYEAVAAIKQQILVEGELIGLYEKTMTETENKAVHQMLHLIRLDSQRHIDILTSAISVIQGEDVFIEDRRPIAKSLHRHLELEMKSVELGDNLLKKTWISDNKGLTALIEHWRDEEKRHHKFIKELSERQYFELSSRDFITLFRDEEFLEKRYRRSKEFWSKHQPDGKAPS